MPHRDRVTSLSRLAFLHSPDGSRDVVLVRDYGAITAVVLDDANVVPESIIRLPKTLAAEFIQPYLQDIVDPELSAYYDQVQLYLTQSSQAVLGPLASARAALYMKERGLPADQAVALAFRRGQALIVQNSARLKALPGPY